MDFQIAIQNWLVNKLKRKETVFNLRLYIRFGLVKTTSPSSLDSNSITVQYLHNGHLRERRKWISVVERFKQESVWRLWRGDRKCRFGGYPDL